MNTFDLREIYHDGRPLSWSGISSFEWNPSHWYRKYVLKELEEATPELKFGGYVDKKIQSDPDYLPHVVRYPVMQHEMRTVYNDIPLIGYSDAWAPEELKLRDYKTGKKPWDQKRANETGQLTLYTGMLYLMEKIHPDDMALFIDWLPTHQKDGKICFIEPDHEMLIPKTFETRRDMQQVLAFFQRIDDTWAKMQAYGKRMANSEIKEW